MNTKKARQLLKECYAHDLYHDRRGDNYLFKNSWRSSRDRQVFIDKANSNNWKNNHHWWDHSQNDLFLHHGVKYKNFHQYEQKINPHYRQKNHQGIYKYDNPLASYLDKYNDQQYKTTTQGYAKRRNNMITSIERKRKEIY